MSIARWYHPLSALACATLTCFAGVEHTTTSCSVQLASSQTEAEPVTVHATTSQAGGLEALSVTYLSRTVQIPAEALRDLRNIDIQRKGSLRGRAYRVDAERPLITFGVDSWDPNYLKQAYGKDIGVPVTVAFHINGLNSVDRTILPCEAPGIPVYDGFLDRRTFTLDARQ